MNLCEPFLERAAIPDSFACGNGRLAAAVRARKFVDRHRWFLKMDIRKYFDNRAHRGMDFLGCRLRPGTTGLNRRSRRRYARKMRRLKDPFASGITGELRLQERATALTAFALQADSEGFRRGFLRRTRSAADGLEPGTPRRELEQRREELPPCEPLPVERGKKGSCPRDV